MLGSMKGHRVATSGRAIDRATPRHAPFSPARPSIHSLSSKRVLCTRAAKIDETQDEKAAISELEARIMSGEFTDTGSTKEKITRPIRKALADEPTGVGE
jgi:hypothetical protein